MKVSEITGIERRSHEQAIDICRLLEHGYQDDEGRTILRELFQNADDARAQTLSIVLLDRIPGARHELLQGPVLLVTNDGPLKASDAEALRGAAGGNKGADETKIGRFGLGLKSVFRLCEAFLYAGSGGGNAEPTCGVVNPHAGSTLFPQWDQVHEDDGTALMAAATAALAKDPNASATGLLTLALPLRKKSHHHGDLCLSGWNPGDALEEIRNQLSNSAPAVALLLPQAGFLRRVHVVSRIGGQDDVIADTSLIPDGRTADSLGRYGQKHKAEREIAAVVEAKDGSTWRVRARELVGDGTELAALRLSGKANWPRDFKKEDDGGFTREPRKAVAHGAVTVIQAAGRPGRPGKVAVRWATFLPLDDGPEPDTQVARFHPLESGAPTMDVLLHGYFWPSEERKRLFGVTEPKRDVQDATLQLADDWNMRLARSHVLPLLPEVLADALTLVPDNYHRAVLSAVASALPLPEHLLHSSALTQRASLLPVLTRTGVEWTAMPVERCGRVRAAEEWCSAPQWAKAQLLEAAESAGFVLAEVTLQVWPFGRVEHEWSSEEIDALLGAFDARVWPRDAKDARWMVAQLGALLEQAPEARSMATLVRQLQTIGLGPNGHRVDGERDQRLALKHAWKPLLNHISRHVVVKTVSATARRAAEWLAEREGTTATYLLVPALAVTTLGRMPAQELVAALESIGVELGVATTATKPVKEHIESLFALATDLVVELGIPALRAHPTLRVLPLLRAWRAQTEDWHPASMATVEKKALDRQLFVCDVVQPAAAEADVDDDADERALVKAPRKEQMAHWTAAMDCDAWLVHPRLHPYGDHAANTPNPKPGRVAPRLLADAILANAGSVRRDAVNRTGLALELVSKDLQENIQRALRFLVHADAKHVNDTASMWYIQPNAEQPKLERACRAILRCRGLQWTLLDDTDATWKGALTGAQLESINLQQLLKIQSILTPDASFSGITEDERRAILACARRDDETFKKLPLHKLHDGALGVLDEHTYRPRQLLPAALSQRVKLLHWPLPEDLQDAYTKNTAEFTDVALLREVLAMERPSVQIDLILGALKAVGGLDRVPDVLGALKDDLCLAEWLPVAGGDRSAAPCDVLFVDPDAEPTLRQLLADLGEQRSFVLWSDVDAHVRDCSQELVCELQDRKAWPETLANVLSKKDSVPVAWRIAPEAAVAELRLLKSLLKSKDLKQQLGWRLLGLATPSTDDDAADLSITTTLANKLVGELDTMAWRDMLNALARGSVRDDHPWFAVCGWRCNSGVISTKELADLRLPTSDCKWRLAGEIALSNIGVPDDRRLDAKARRLLGLDGENSAIESPTFVSGTDRELVADELYDFLVERTRTVDIVVAALLAIHTGPVALDVAARLLQSKEQVQKIRDKFGTTGPKFAVKFYRSGSPRGQWPLLSLTNSTFNLPDWDARKSLVTEMRLERGERRNDDNVLTRFNIVHVVFEDVVLSNCTSRNERLEYVREWAESWSQIVALPAFGEWWRVHTDTTQADLEPLRIQLVDQLPAVLESLGLQDDEFDEVRSKLRQVRAAEQAANELARDAGPSRTSDLGDRLRKSVQLRESLADLISQAPMNGHILARVRKYMGKQGYTSASIPLELLQNADDALVQLAQIRG